MYLSKLMFKNRNNYNNKKYNLVYNFNNFDFTSIIRLLNYYSSYFSFINLFYTNITFYLFYNLKYLRVENLIYILKEPIN